jgi:hippurate hydrolase
MASFDRVTVTLRGRSAHGAMPHHGIDSMQCAASIVLGLQSIITREIDAQQAAVITVGSIQAGEVFNIVPESAVLKIGVRALHPDVRSWVETRIKAFCAGPGRELSAQLRHRLRAQVPGARELRSPDRIRAAGGHSLLGEDKVGERTPTMGSEDFAYMLQKRPAPISGWATAWARTEAAWCTTRCTTSTTRPCT